MAHLSGYNLVNLEEFLQEYGEDKTNAFLSSFSCPQNKDVETFLKEKAILFVKQRISATYLVITSYQETPVLVGYFTISPKSILFDMNCGLSKTMKRKINKYGRIDLDTKKLIITVMLIGQLGKNYHNNYNSLISGYELLGLCLDVIADIQIASGGALIFVECEDIEYLNKFYEDNGFVTYAVRRLDGDETNLKGDYLVQKIAIKKSPIPDNREHIPFYRRSSKYPPG